VKLQLVAVGTKMPDWVQTGFTEYLRRFPKDMPFELVEIPAGKRGKNADIKRILATSTPLSSRIPVKATIARRTNSADSAV